MSEWLVAGHPWIGTDERASSGRECMLASYWWFRIAAGDGNGATHTHGTDGDAWYLATGFEVGCVIGHCPLLVSGTWIDRSGGVVEWSPWNCKLVRND